MVKKEKHTTTKDITPYILTSARRISKTLGTIKETKTLIEYVEKKLSRNNSIGNYLYAVYT